MQGTDWNDLRYVLAMARDGSFAAAARRLAIDPTTVARRLRAMEEALGARLFERDPGGDMRLTQAGEVVVNRAEAMEAEVGALEAAVKGADNTASGTVRVTAVPILINRVLVPAIHTLHERHPDLRLELAGEFGNLNLTRRDADIAVRQARPDDTVGSQIIAKRIGTLRYAPYVAIDHPRADELPWLAYDETMSHLPQSRWIEKAAARSGGLAAIAVNDAETIVRAIETGLGRGLLPTMIGDRVSGIVRTERFNLPPPEREIWLLSHPDMRHLARISKALNWIEQTVRAVEGESS